MRSETVSRTCHPQKCVSEAFSGYYRKRVPRFVNISRQLTSLKRKMYLLMYLPEGPLLKYSDLDNLYTLFTDAGKYAWSCILTQAYTHAIDDKKKTVLHPISYMKNMFKGIQLKWTALTNEAYAMYTFLKKSTILFQ